MVLWLSSTSYNVSYGNAMEEICLTINTCMPINTKIVQLIHRLEFSVLNIVFFLTGTKKMEYKTRQWHEKCFSCVVCKSSIGTKSFIPRDQEVYCATCYEEKFSTRCVKCDKVTFLPPPTPDRKITRT